MDIVMIAVPLIAVALLGAALRAPLPQTALPGLFALMVACVSLGYVAAAHGWRTVGALAVAGALAATASLALAVCAHEQRLAWQAALAGAAMPPSLSSSRRERWRRFERDFWAYVAAHSPGHRGNGS